MRDKNNSKKNQAAVELGRLGGKKGGPARASKLTSEERTEIARNAANKRWASVRERANMSESWSKQLSASEAIRPSQGAPMPFVRCTQAGHEINHASWFREILFNGAGWEKTDKESESISVPFEVTIGEQNLGDQTLTVSYKPVRTENNSAPTTHIIYNETIKEALMNSDDLTGRTLTVTASEGRFKLSIS